MKAWTTATAPGQCSYDGGHTWIEGARVFAVQGATWRKLYCRSCGPAYMAAPPDTGEILDVESQPAYPKALLQFTGVTQALFDPKMAALPPSDRNDA